VIGSELDFKQIGGTRTSISGQPLKIDFRFQPELQTSSITQHQRIQITKRSSRVILIVCLPTLVTCEHCRHDTVQLLRSRDFDRALLVKLVEEFGGECSKRVESKHSRSQLCA